ncbi:hypothetical protein [uncultured Nocardioides sp.]|uniref:hypothetical protein n=1 Tax=uncultured Nocardioides sp. TaxID=198441 RepID=UPI002621B58B|nr:hypothetical protein [uncultured Nocardioides sp.]
MDLVDVPASTRQLDQHEHLDVPHRLIAAPRPLEVGQVVVLRDLDGRHRWAAVDRLRFTETDTVYEMQLGHPMPLERAVEVGAYESRRMARPFVRVPDVHRMLDGMREQNARARAEETARRSRVRPA